MVVLYVLCAILGIGIIIFIHELGHFLAAKKVGIRVERFALGFDPPFRGRHLRFFSFRRGETEYVLGMIPFGGYVKMAGEMLPDTEAQANPAPDEFLAKSVGARAFVLVAGAAMNIGSAFFFFALAFAIGVPFIAPEVGKTVAQTPAWEAGLEAGDKIVAIDGKRSTRFEDLMLGVALGSGEPVSITIDRSKNGSQQNDEPGEILQLTVVPEYSDEGGMWQIGVAPPVDPTLARDPVEGSPAWNAGLRSGDTILGARIDGTELLDLAPAALIEELILPETQAEIPPGPGVALLVEKRDSRLGEARERKWVELERPEIESSRSEKILIVPGGGNVVRAIAPGSAADEPFNPGDRVVAISGRPVSSMAWREIASVDGDQLTLEIESLLDGSRRTETVEKRALLLWTLEDHVVWGSPGLLAAESENPSAEPTTASREPQTIQTHDVLVKAGGQLVWSEDDLQGVLEKSGKNVAVQVFRGGETLEFETSPAALSHKTWSDFPPIRSLVPGGPADRAGIRAGSRITAIGGKEVLSFNALREMLGDQKPGSQVELAWIDAEGREKVATVALDAKTYEPIGLAESFAARQKVIRAGVLESFGLGMKSTADVGKQVFLTLRSLVRQDVSAKNLSGPVGITTVFAFAAESGLGRFLYFIAMVSVNLGLLNLLPFPILDGGHLFFLLIEKVKGSPVSLRVQEVATSVAFFLILALFLFVTFHDVRRILPF